MKDAEANNQNPRGDHNDENEKPNLRVMEDSHIFLKKVPKVSIEDDFTLRVRSNRKFIFSIHSSVITTITNGRLDLGKVHSRLENEASNHGYKFLKWPLNDTIFKHVDVNEFKHACNTVLRDINIILYTNPLTVSDNDERLRLIKRFHDDPLTGGHLGRNKIYAKMRDSYHWKGMSKDIAQYVKN